jgi:hypothetical protein
MLKILNLNSNATQKKNNNFFSGYAVIWTQISLMKNGNHCHAAALYLQIVSFVDFCQNKFNRWMVYLSASIKRSWRQWTIVWTKAKTYSVLTALCKLRNLKNTFCSTVNYQNNTDKTNLSVNHFLKVNNSRSIHLNLLVWSNSCK